MTEKKPKVSVCVVTYNHEKYIRQCLQSIVDQKTDFDFEVIVGEDCSTDGTRAIVEEFVDRYPEIVIINFQDINVGPTKNYFSTQALARGEYIAHCDGDDYWLPNKLNYQTRILDEQPDFVFVADYWNNSKNKDTKIDIFNQKELFKKGNPVLHSSKLFRSKYIFDLSPMREYLDFEIHLRQLENDKLCYLCRAKTTVHTINSTSSIRSTVNSKWVSAYMSLFDYATSIGISKSEIDKIYNLQMRGFLKIAAYTNDKIGVSYLTKVIKHSKYRIEFITNFYLFLATSSFFSSLLRYLRFTKRKFLNRDGA